MPVTPPKARPVDSSRMDPGRSTPGPIVALEGDALAASRASEWVLANGLGGFAMGTASGTTERRYHAILVAATKPPVGRVATLVGIDEAIVVEGPTPQAGVRRYQLSTFRFSGTGEAGTPLNPMLRRFERLPGGCRWVFAGEGGVGASRELSLERGRNAALVRYAVSTAGARAWLELRPLVAIRDFHRTLHEHEGAWRFAMPPGSDAGGCPSLSIAAEGVRLKLALSVAGRFVEERTWWRHFEYRRDLERGQADGREDLFCPGVFVTELVPGRAVELGAWCDEGPAPSGMDRLLGAWRDRLGSSMARVKVGKGARGDAISRAMPALLEAGDQFVVSRGGDSGGSGGSGVSIIAGYPWFSDWGRDSMISVRGLLIATRRFEEALGVLGSFASHLRGGIIPNVFDDATGHAEYNTADASLWFIHASVDYLEASGDRGGFERRLLPACVEIVRAYRAGTEHGIRVGADGLVVAGSEGSQLTWMDAKRDGVVFTPRHGKPVELSALWCSGLARLSRVVERPADAKDLAALSAIGSASFGSAFWDASRGCLFDVLTPEGAGWRANAQVRPNQLFAVCMPHSPLTLAQQRSVVACVRDRLLTPAGVRTLDPADPGYRGRFEGSLFERDGAYHNGTAWPWLLGPYAEAVMRAGEFSRASREEAMGTVTPMLEAIARAAPGGSIATIAEVYDGDDSPRRPRRSDGCMAQAWSVAEVLRIVALARGDA